MDRISDTKEMKERLSRYRAEQNPEMRRTMSVPEMRKLLGLKKTESYWLVHRKFFKTEMIGGRMRVDIESFERWYANQVKHKKVNGEPAGKELKKISYSFKEAANLLGVYPSTLYEIWNKEDREIITVDFVKRIPKEAFDVWYEGQNKYKKSEKMPTEEEMKDAYILSKEAARLLGLRYEAFQIVMKESEYRNLFEIYIFDEKKWISKKSFQFFLNSQTVYQMQEKENVLIKEEAVMGTKKFISKKEAAEIARVSMATITKWMWSEEFEFYEAGKVIRIHREGFLSWLRKNRGGML